jgi:hypothetical protein
MNIPGSAVCLIAVIMGCAFTAIAFLVRNVREMKQERDAARRDLSKLSAHDLDLHEHAREVTARLARAEGTLHWVHTQLPKTLEKLKATLTSVLNELAKDVGGFGEGILGLADRRFTSQESANDARCSTEERRKA